MSRHWPLRAAFSEPRALATPSSPAYVWYRVPLSAVLAGSSKSCVGQYGDEGKTLGDADHWDRHPCGLHAAALIPRPRVFRRDAPRFHRTRKTPRGVARGEGGATLDGCLIILRRRLTGCGNSVNTRLPLWRL